MGRGDTEPFRCNNGSCWMCTSGRCLLLIEPTDEESCSFAKTYEEVEAGRKMAHERLLSLGERGLKLIKKYEYNPQRTW